MNIDNKYIVRFWEHVDIKGEDDCWLWLRSTDLNGYGAYGIKGKSIKVHRFSYLLANGILPNGLLVLHTCDTNSCVNPRHLYLSKRHRSPMKGINFVKLKIRNVRDIRRMYATDKYTQAQLAKRFKVSINAINSVVNYISWKKV